ncbi:MFS transporter [Oscillatoria sp. FACHB-1406]|uniref:MFS transporter n=1 Tax=Oscillatoria sp. FACHB-1406 TaxID=2692846 RepID=UPI001F54B385|nr:MFS transporter [Oscillatoria sp. FACHB-1406]
MGANRALSLLAQQPVEVVPAPVVPTAEGAERAALALSGPQFFTALIAGVVLAFAFQLLLTNLGVAVGISMAGGSSDDSSDRGDSESFGSSIRKISTLVGVSTLITVAISLFVACYFAVRLSLFATPLSGAIVGLVIWATYFSLMVWVSSTTVGSLVGSVINTATSGLQAIVGTAAAAIGGKAASNQMVSTAEAMAAAVRREFTAGLDPESFRENVEDYIQKLRPAQLDPKAIRAQFEELVNDPNLKKIASAEGLANIDRATFVDLISSRTDLSKREVNRLADELEDVWKKTFKSGKISNPLQDLGDYLKSATREQLLGKELNDKIDALRAELKQNNTSDSPTTEVAASSGVMASLSSLAGMVLGRADLSDFDADKAIAQIEKLKDYASEQANQVGAKIDKATKSGRVKADIDEYLSNAYPWQLTPENLDREFRDLLYDTEADPGAVADELSNISRADFVQLLQKRETSTILPPARLQSTASALESIRREVLATAEAARNRQESMTLLAEVESYLMNADLRSPQGLETGFQALIDDADVDVERLKVRLAQLNRTTLDRILTQRADLTPETKAGFIGELELIRDRVIAEAEQRQLQATTEAEGQWETIQNYLRSTGKSELNPDAIEREVKLLLKDPQAGAAALRARASRFDRDTLLRLLAQRQDMTRQEAEELLDRLENSWARVVNAPQELTGKVKDQYDRATTSIADYLRSTGKPELSPEGIQRDLKRLLDDPKAGYQSIKWRLARMDRDTLVQLLAQRDDLTEEQVNSTIDSVQATLDDIAKTPRRLARRTQQQVRDFQTSLADYLRSTGKEELDPDDIQRDVQLLLNDPRAGMESLQERLSKFDRDTLVQLLSQREDISQADANRIIDNILSVRDRAVQQLQLVQAQVQSAIDSVLGRIRNYLNSLQRPELNYEGISTDLRTLFDDPQAGFDALRDRFSQLDRNTLVAVLSSRDDISRADAERLVSQVEGTRDRVLQRAERLQRQTLLQVERTKQQAQRQLEETRKAASAAAWWLFLTALISALCSAGGGALGVDRFV